MKLSNEDISKVVDDIDSFLQNTGVSRKDRIKIILIIEEFLILYQKQSGSEHEVEISTKNILNNSRITIRIKGEPFNSDRVIERQESIFTDEVFQNLTNYEHVDINYRYINGFNEINVFSSKEKKKFKIPGGTISIIALAAVICGILCRQILSSDIQSLIVNQFVNQFNNTLMGLIVAVTGPFIFLSVVSGICVMDDVTTLNKIGLKVIKRFLAVTLFVTVVSGIVSEIFFPVIDLKGESSFDLSELISLLLQIIPTNLFTPFTEGKVLQIVLIAIFVGICVLILGNVINNFKTFVYECNKIIFKMMDIVSKVIFVAIFLSIFKIILTSNIEDIISSWQIIAVNYISLIIACSLMLIRLSIKYKLNIANFLKTISKVLAISFSTASNTAAMSTNIEVLKNDLKISEKLCDFWIPLSHSMFSPSASGALLLSVFFCAYVTNVTISPINLLIAIFLSIQLSIATPPVPGGIMAIYTILLSQLNIPLDGIGLLIMANVFIVNFSSVMSMLIRDCELMDFSHQVNF